MPLPPTLDHKLRLHAVDQMSDERAREITRALERRISEAKVPASVVRAGVSLVMGVSGEIPSEDARLLASSGELVIAEVDDGSWLRQLDLNYPDTSLSTLATTTTQFHYLRVATPDPHPVEKLAPQGLRMLRHRDEEGWMLVGVRADELRAKCLLAEAVLEDAEWIVRVRLIERDGDKLHAITARAIGRHATVAVDDLALSIPVVQDAISRGALAIPARNELYARLLAAVLRHPAPVRVMP